MYFLIITYKNSDVFTIGGQQEWKAESVDC